MLAQIFLVFEFAVITEKLIFTIGMAGVFDYFEEGQLKSDQNEVKYAGPIPTTTALDPGDGKYSPLPCLPPPLPGRAFERVNIADQRTLDLFQGFKLTSEFKTASSSAFSVVETVPEGPVSVELLSPRTIQCLQELHATVVQRSGNRSSTGIQLAPPAAQALLDGTAKADT